MTTTKIKPTAKVSHAKAKPAQELPTISVVRLVPLAAIDIAPQVRTIFDDETIQELANDISTRGLLQPVLLNPHGNRFTLIAGERRVRACRLAGLSDVPALITKASQADALLMQLAENIQREDLDLQDEVNAIRLLHDSLKSVQAVADTVKKSPGWVSKRLALSHPDLSWEARRLMEDGITEDVEILNCLSSLCAISYAQGHTLNDAIRAGTATRETARQALKEAKAAKKEAAGVVSTMNPAERERLEVERKADFERRQEEIKAHDNERKDGTGPLFIEAALRQMQIDCAEPTDEEPNATTYLNSLREDQRNALVSHLQHVQTKAKAWALQDWARCLTPYDSEYTYLEQFVAIMAIKKPSQGVDNLFALVTILEGANMEAE